VLGFTSDAPAVQQGMDLPRQGFSGDPGDTDGQTRLRQDLGIDSRLLA
jgi:hypothetical protein